jgi:hypothetical protein
VLQDKAIASYLDLLSRADMVTMPPWMEQAQRERMPAFAPEGAEARSSTTCG